jgi:hypothetical protein
MNMLNKFRKKEDAAEPTPERKDSLDDTFAYGR